MITTVILDLDGLLVDTEPLHCRAYQEVLRSQGATLKEADYIQHWVRSGKGIGEWIADHGLELDSREIRAQKSRLYLQLVASSLCPMDGLFGLLERLHAKKKLALASSSYRDAVDGVLQGLKIAHYFEVIVTGTDVSRVKPAPDIFLAAARRMGAAASECVVLEDAEKGVLAAYAAGMRCIAVPNEHTRDHDFSNAALVCSSLNEITIELLETLNG